MRECYENIGFLAPSVGMLGASAVGAEVLIRVAGAKAGSAADVARRGARAAGR